MTKGNAQDYIARANNEIHERLVKKYSQKSNPYLTNYNPFNHIIIGSRFYDKGEIELINRTRNGTIYNDMMEVIMDAIQQKLTINKYDPDIKALFTKMKTLIEERKVDVNYAYPMPDIKLGMRPIHIAALAGDIEMMQFLKSKNADLTLVDNKRQNFLHYSLCSCDPISSYVALEIVDSETPEIKSHIFGQKNNLGESILDYAVVRKPNNMFVTDFLLFSSFDYDSSSIIQAMRLASLAKNTEANYILDDYNVLKNVYTDPAEFQLILKFRRLEKVIELELCDDEIYKEGIEHDYIMQSKEKHHAIWIEHFNAMDQDKKDRFFTFALSFASQIIKNHFRVNLESEISKKLVTKVLDVIHEILPSISPEKLAEQYDPDSKTLSLVHLAAYCDNNDILTDSIKQIEKNQQLTIQDCLHLGVTQPLYYAIRGNNIDMVTTLVALGANPSCPNGEGDNALSSCVILKRYEIFDRLLESHPNLAHDTNLVKKDNVVHWAAFREIEVMTKLLEKDVDPTIFNSLGNNALHLAAQHNRFDIICLLLDSTYHDQLINSQNELDGNTILHYLANEKNSEEVRLEGIKLVLGNGADPTIKNNDGKNLLHFATENNLENIVTLLLDSSFKDALINEVDKEGNTALHYAVIKRYETIANTLIDYGASKNIKNKNGQLVNDLKHVKGVYLNPSHEERIHDAKQRLHQVLAISKSILESSSRMIDIDYSVYDIYRKTALPKEELESPKGWTLAHIVARHGKEEDLRNFVKDGFDINAKTDKGLTVLDCAILSKNNALIDMIVNHPKTTLDSLKNAIGTAIKLSDSTTFQTIVSSQNLFNCLSDADNTQLNQFFSDCHKMIAKPKSKTGAVFKDSIAQLRHGVELTKKIEKDNALNERQLMAQEDERRIQKREEEKRRTGENRQMQAQEDRMRDFLAQEKEEIAHQTQLMLREEQHTKNIIAHHKEAKETKWMTKHDFSINPDSVIASQGEPKERFIAQMNHFLTYANEKNLDATLSILPEPIKQSGKAFLQQGYDFELRGSAVNRDLNSRVASDLDIMIKGDVRNASEEKLTDLFQYHFGASQSQITFFKVGGGIDTVQYKDEERKIDVTLYDRQSISSGHWIDTMERKWRFELTKDDIPQLKCSREFNDGCFDYMQKNAIAITEQMEQNKTILFHKNAKDLLLISAFRLSAYPDYNAVNQSLAQYNYDLVGSLNSFQPACSSSGSMLRDICRRDTNFTRKPYQDQKDAAKSYIRNFMQSHKMEKEFQSRFLQNLKTLIDDQRNFTMDIQTFPYQTNGFGAITKLFNPIQEAVDELKKSMKEQQKPKTSFTPKNSKNQRASYVATP